VSAAAAARACRRHLRGGSRSFHAAGLLLPRRYAAPATALYAFCRLADDAIDQGAAEPERALAGLHARLDRVYAAAPGTCPAERAFTEVVQRCAIPRALPEALLEGFEWDVRGRRYRDFEALSGYAARVAGTVGAMMALVMDTREPAALARASDLGIAMQLTNIARDIGEDARAGRLYLPEQWFADAGLDPDAWLARPVFDAPLRAMLERLLDAADGLYARGEAGTALLPPACRPGILAARLLYAEIGNHLRRPDADPVRRRAVVGGRRKALLLARALGHSFRTAVPERAPALAAARFLVDSVPPAPPRPRRGLPSPQAWLDAKCAFVVELFTRLERMERGELEVAGGSSLQGP